MTTAHQPASAESRQPDQRDEDRPTVLCIPYAGGAARVFADLARALPQAVTVPLELAGRGMRMREPASSDLGTVVEDLARQTALHTSGRYLLVGHSMGAALAFEVARYWTGWGRPPAAVVLAGRNGPGAGSKFPPIHGLETSAFLAAIRRLGGTPPQLFENPELIRLFTPLLRSDFTLSETYRPLSGAELTCPVWVCAGADDPMADRAGLLDWDQYTTGELTCELLPGAHFILDDPAFHQFVARALSECAQPARIA
ncbi:thioesterase II family protein [Streptacidiphilus sp. EB129]|uniref:thioesterase II family protein n=1 Tax=Streptacidiphilus sp. EB129 TaxID=3156262 RepID=UPI0035124119